MRFVAFVVATLAFLRVSQKRARSLLFQMPHSNEDSGRVFSMVNKICTEHRADLAQDTVAALLSVKVNSRLDSQRFEPHRNELSNAKSATMEYNRLHLHPA